MSTTDRPLSFFIPSLTVGGAQRVTVTLVNELARRGYPVDLVLAFRRGKLLSEVSPDVTVYDLTTPSVPVVGLGACLPQLRTYLRTRKPFALFSQMTYTNVVALSAIRLSGTDVIAVPTEHNTLGEKAGLKDRLVDAMAARLYGDATRLVGVSQGVVETAVHNSSAPADRGVVMYNPMPVAEIRERANETVDHPWFGADNLEVILSVGRLEPQKDLKMLIRAFARVHEQRAATRLVVAGKGSLHEELSALAEQLGIEEAVSLPGYVDNQYACMDRASVFALSSRHEGLPTTLIEAMACGCPVVSTDCPSGPNEILDGGSYGPLVAVGDDEAFAKALLETLDNPALPSRLRARADDFAVDAVGAKYERFVKELGYSEITAPMGTDDGTR